MASPRFGSRAGLAQLATRSEVPASRVGINGLLDGMALQPLTSCGIRKASLLKKMHRRIVAGLPLRLYINVLSDQRVRSTLKLMDRPPDTRLNNDTAREVCLRTNSKALVSGSIESVGSHYLIGLRALDCQTGDTLASAKAEADNRDAVRLT